MISRTVRGIGILLFGISFFLPAVGEKGGGVGTEPLLGWQCALSSLEVPLGMLLEKVGITYGQSSSLTSFSQWFRYLELFGAGLVVPMVLVYLFVFLNQADKTSSVLIARRVLAVAILAGLACAWCYLEFSGSPQGNGKLTPMIGHDLWTLGTLLILAPEIIPDSANQSTPS